MSSALRLLVVLVALFASPAFAKPVDDAKKWVVVVYASTGEGVAGANKSLAFEATSSSPSIDALFTALGRNRTTGTLDAGEVARLLRNHGEDLAKAATNRWLASAGDSVVVYVIHDGGLDVDIGITETARNSRFRDDLKTFVQLVTKVGGFSTLKVKAPCVATVKRYQLVHVRATLKVAVTSKESATRTGICRDSSDTTGTGAATPSIEATVLTGPRERFFLSANIGGSDARQTKYDAATRTLTPLSKPEQFFAGLNLSFGDLLTERPSFFRTAYLGLLVEGSKKPWQQVGAVVGTRHIPLVSRLVELGTISPYAGVLWVRSDSLLTDPANASVVREIRARYGKGSVVFGLSLNLSKATGWVGGD